MSYVCVKPITLLGNNYKPGELIQDGHILPSRERALVRTGCIAEVSRPEKRTRTETPTQLQQISGNMQVLQIAWQITAHIYWAP